MQFFKTADTFSQSKLMADFLEIGQIAGDTNLNKNVNEQKKSSSTSSPG